MLLVGDYDDAFETWLFDGTSYSHITRTNADHSGGGAAQYLHSNGERGVVLTAGQFNYEGMTEWYSPTSNTWTRMNRTEGHAWLYGFTMATVKNTVFLFGGKELWAAHRQDVYQMRITFDYDILPERMQSISRHQFTTIQQQNRILHFGGDRDQFAECWTLNEFNRKWE